MPESSKSLNSLDPGIRRDDVVPGKHSFLNGYYIDLKYQKSSINCY